MTIKWTPEMVIECFTQNKLPSELEGKQTAEQVPLKDQIMEAITRSGAKPQ